MADLLVGIPILVALIVVYAWGVVLGANWAARRGWPWPAQAAAALVTGAYAPFLFVLRVLARWIGWQPKPKDVTSLPLMTEAQYLALYERMGDDDLRRRFEHEAAASPLVPLEHVRGMYLQQPDSPSPTEMAQQAREYLAQHPLDAGKIGHFGGIPLSDLPKEVQEVLRQHFSEPASGPPPLP